MKATIMATKMTRLIGAAIVHADTPSSTLRVSHVSVFERIDNRDFPAIAFGREQLYLTEEDVEEA